MKNILILCIFLAELVFTQVKWEKLAEPLGGSARKMYAKGDTILAEVNNGIYFSTNKGEKWYKSQAVITDIIKGFTHSDDGAFFTITSAGIYRTYDLMNWSIIRSGSHTSIGRDIRGNLYTISGIRVYASYNNGNTWTRIDYPNEIYFSSILGLGEYLFISGRGVILRKNIVTGSFWEVLTVPLSNPLEMTGDDSGMLYVISWGRQVIARSSDFGITWNYIHLGDHFPSISLHGIAFKDNTILISSGNSPRLFVSHDNGITWTTSVHYLPLGSNVNSIITAGNEFFVSTWGGGIFKSSDGDEWIPVNNNINEVLFQGLVRRNNSLIGSTWGLGVLISDDEGKNWQGMNEGLTTVNTGRLLLSSDETLYLSTTDGLYKREISDTVWNHISSLVRRYWYTYLDHKDRIYAHDQYSVYLSKDKGSTWNPILKYSSISNIYMSPDGHLFVSTFNSPELLRSSDKGTTWRAVYQGKSSLPVSGGDGVLFAAVESGIIRSTDEGRTWHLQQFAFNNTKAQKLYSDNNGKYYITTQNPDLYYSDDECETWNSVWDGLSRAMIWDILFSGDQVFLASDRGIWKNTSGFTVSSAEESNYRSFSLFQNYPNPFNPSTTIKYSVSETGVVTLSIYDLLGSEVIKLLEEEKPAGEYELKWNASGYPSGVYFIRMQAGQFSDMRKLLLMK
jgi:photosystem II stability/assembly factor-like uncharacterized protein